MSRQRIRRAFAWLVQGFRPWHTPLFWWLALAAAYGAARAVFYPFR